jgi:DNA-binding transcriptional ArsR family regulator
MVELSQERALNLVFRALAHPARRAMVRRLERGPCSVGELAEGFTTSLPAVSKHLRVLEEARVVQRTWRGTTAECRLNPAALKSADAWIARYREYWTGGLDRLANLVERPARGAKLK